MSAKANKVSEYIRRQGDGSKATVPERRWADMFDQLTAKGGGRRECGECECVCLGREDDVWEVRLGPILRISGI